MARAIADGARPAMAINAGVVTGDLLFFALAAAGMAAAAQSLGDFFTSSEWPAPRYLAWQGIALWRRGRAWPCRSTAPATRRTSGATTAPACC